VAAGNRDDYAARNERVRAKSDIAEQYETERLKGLAMMSQCEAGSVEATLIPGVGIGPEIAEVVKFVLDGLGSPFVWDMQQVEV
jgi:hypothetical protein